MCNNKFLGIQAFSVRFVPFPRVDPRNKKVRTFGGGTSSTDSKTRFIASASGSCKYLSTLKTPSEAATYLTVQLRRQGH